MAPTQRDVDPAPTVYVEAVAKFAKVNVRSAKTSSALRYSVDIAASLTDALANLPAIDQSSKPEIAHRSRRSLIEAGDRLLLRYTRGEPIHATFGCGISQRSNSKGRQ